MPRVEKISSPVVGDRQREKTRIVPDKVIREGKLHNFLLKANVTFMMVLTRKKELAASPSLVFFNLMTLDEFTTTKR